MQSVSIRDFLLYADFLPSSEELLDLPLDVLIKRMDLVDVEGREELGPDPRETSLGIKDEESNISSILSSTLTNCFLDLEVVCVDDQGQDLRLPPVRVYLKSQSNQNEKQKQKLKSKQNQKSSNNEKKKNSVRAAVAMARKKMFGWLKTK